MKFTIRTMFAAVAGMAILAGCSGATDVSTQPSKAEIDEGVQRRIKEIENRPGLTPEQKEAQIARVRGSTDQKEAESRKEGVGK